MNGDQVVGTCFQVAPGLIVTAWHVVLDAGAEEAGAEVTVGPLEPDVGDPFVATVKLFDAPNDLAVLGSSGDLGGSIQTLSPSDAIAWNAKLIVTGVADLADVGQYPYTDALGDPGGRALRNPGNILLCRMKSSDVVPGMSGAPVRLSDDETVLVGIVSGRYNSADGWFRDSVWMARTEDLEALLEGLDDGIQRPQRGSSPAVSLSPAEQLALGLILCDPMAAERGAWLYPLHQDLGSRGLSTAQTTLALTELKRLGLIEYLEIPGVDTLTGEESAAPAYRITNMGASVAATYPGVSNFQDRYSYVLRMSGDEASNEEFLARLKSLPAVEAQTRFIVQDRDGVVRIAVWSHEPLTEVFSSISSDTGSSILNVRET